MGDGLWFGPHPYLSRGDARMHTAVRPCEQFGPERAEAIEALCESASGAPCPVRTGGVCPWAANRELPALEAVC